jgi:hypothetical protein
MKENQMKLDLKAIIQFMNLGINSKSLIDIKKKTLEEFFNIHGDSGIFAFFKYLEYRDEQEIRHYDYLREIYEKEKAGKKKKK